MLSGVRFAGPLPLPICPERSYKTPSYPGVGGCGVQALCIHIHTHTCWLFPWPGWDLPVELSVHRPPCPGFSLSHVSCFIVTTLANRVP